MMKKCSHCSSQSGKYWKELKINKIRKSAKCLYLWYACAILRHCTKWAYWIDTIPSRECRYWLVLFVIKYWNSREKKCCKIEMLLSFNPVIIIQCCLLHRVNSPADFSLCLTTHKFMKFINQSTIVDRWPSMCLWWWFVFSTAFICSDPSYKCCFFSLLSVNWIAEVFIDRTENENLLRNS